MEIKLTFSNQEMIDFLEKLGYNIVMQQEGWMDSIRLYAYKGIKPSHVDRKLHEPNSLKSIFTKELKAKLLSL